MKAKVINNNEVVETQPDDYIIPVGEEALWYPVIENPWKAVWAGLPDDTRSTEEKMASIYLDNWNYVVNSAGLSFTYKYVPAYANGQAMYVSTPMQGNVVYEVVPAAPILPHRLNDLAYFRWEKETGGINFDNKKIATDRESQGLLTGARVKIMNDPTTIIDWKTGSGWIQLGALQIEAISDAVAYHVEYCFSKEKEHGAAMALLTDAYDLMAYDFTTGFITAWQEGAVLP